MPRKTFKSRRYDIRLFGKKNEGYAFIDAPGGRSKYVYTEEIFSRRPGAISVRTQRILYYVFSIIGIILLFVAGGPSSYVNQSGFISIATCISIFLFMWLIFTLIIMLQNGNELTIWAFRTSSLQFNLITLILGILMTMSAVFTLIYILTFPDKFLPWDIWGLVFRTLSAAAFLSCAIIEYRTDYDVEYPE